MGNTTKESCVHVCYILGLNTDRHLYSSFDCVSTKEEIIDEHKNNRPPWKVDGYFYNH